MRKNFTYYLALVILVIPFDLCVSQKTYRVRSFDGTKQWKMIAATDPGTNLLSELYLSELSSQLSIDAITFGNNGGSFALDTLNGGHIIKVYNESSGTGFYGRHLAIYAVVGHRFHQLFHAYLAMLEVPDPDSAGVRTLSTIQFKDINADGFTEIIEESSADLVDPGENFNVWKKGDLEAAKSIGPVSKRRQIYYWNPPSLTFETKIVKD